MYVSAGQIIVLLVDCLLPSRRQSPASASIQGDAPAQCHFPLLGMCRVRRVCKRCLLIILFDTDSMDWIAAGKATLGTTKEIKRQRLLRSDTSREELPSPAHQKQKTESRKQRVEKSRYRQRLLPESPGCQYTVREKLVFK